MHHTLDNYHNYLVSCQLSRPAIVQVVIVVRKWKHAQPIVVIGVGGWKDAQLIVVVVVGERKDAQLIVVVVVGSRAERCTTNG